MTRSRHGEPDRTWFRSERIYRREDAWYIMTREGLDIGPYHSADAARKEAERLVELLAEAPSAAAAALLIKEFQQRPRRD